ncbi:tryptophan synthase subunit beta, partial [archaeon]
MGNGKSRPGGSPLADGSGAGHTGVGASPAHPSTTARTALLQHPPAAPGATYAGAPAPGVGTAGGAQPAGG